MHTLVENCSEVGVACRDIEYTSSLVFRFIPATRLSTQSTYRVLSVLRVQFRRGQASAAVSLPSLPNWRDTVMTAIAFSFAGELMGLSPT